ncbi:DUF3231 family protein [Natranaerobius thermophilus]|uniref:DUF3231 family protein n=1 Tax=Natranaerobius thermophilus (strain ATCC BAA-1301 / DSM 18059 / JW/NM-WN-LF) TaxID=457570 RepID=B2A7P5_NATTJ|nr:DUF3231 family protein [Natranaerobius thermophilus]ACB84347.1 hypothetical protein Nther_0757 [Natranaerobius thermophilus JW/NM-WN-LF]
MKIFRLLNPKNASIFKKSLTAEQELSSMEAFNIWNSLRARYLSFETYQLFRNFVHDREFDLLLSQHQKHFQKQIKILESEASKFKVKVPDRPPEYLRTSVHIDAITDRMIFRKIFSDMLSELYLLSSAITTSTVNDNLRSHYMNFVKSHLTDYENLYKFGKLKGWVDVEPAFKTNKPGEREELATSEANHLWDHINIRYQQLQLTQIFMNFIHDQDFQLLLNRGLTRLQSQLKVLEREASKYEVPMPDKPPASQPANIDPEVMEDKFVFRTIFKGIEDAINLHIQATISTVRNDNLRTIFSKYLDDEFKMFNDLVRYGKLKGWAHKTPMYRKS